MEKEKKCIFCNSEIDITDDHIPPKNLFPKPRPSDLITVPCCGECNGSFSKDDEYFRNILVSCESVCGDVNVMKVNQKFLRSMKRPEARGLKIQMLNSLAITNSVSRGGIYLGKKPVMQIDAKRLDNTITRIAKGLFYKINGYCIPGNYSTTMTFDKGEQTPSEFEKQIGPYWEPAQSIGNDIFKYTYAICNNNPNAMAIIFWFYDKLFFYGIIAPSQQGREKQASSPIE